MRFIRIGLLGVLLISGCVSTPPVFPPRWQISVPSADAAPARGTVWLRHDGKAAEDGNSYTIEFYAVTNTYSGLAENAAYDADLATNRWPARRCHIDLSIDGGSNWIRRIAYGAQVDAARVHGQFTWSPPEDYSLLTSNAVLRAVLLDAGHWPTRTPAMPYDLAPGAVPRSPPFSIVGCTIDHPAGGILWQGSQVQLTWRQLGGGSVYNLYWLTPDSAGIDFAHWITTISNVVTGANSKYISLNAPVAAQVKLALVSVSEPSIIGYSQAFTVDP